MKLPIQPGQYDRSAEQQRSGLIERELSRTLKRDANETLTGTLAVTQKLDFYTGQDGGWRDIIGTYRNPSTAANAPTWAQIGSGPFYAWKFGLNDIQTYYFHIPHDYSPGTNLFLHAHWLPSGTNTQQVKWEFTYSFAKGFNQGAFNTTGTTVSVAEAGPGVAYRHMVTEIASGSSISGSGIEVDGILMVVLKRITNGGTDNTDDIFLLMSDVHYQANTFATKNRAPDFYT